MPMLVFLADCHLDAAGGERADGLLRLLGRLPAEGVTALYVLGDLFDAWTGPADVERPAWRPVIESLRGLPGRGVEVTVLRGNRDFALGPELGVRVVDGDLCLDLDGRRVVLSHGDRLCLADTRYQAYRRLVRGPAGRCLQAVLPEAWKAWGARAIRGLSRREVRRKACPTMDVSPRAVRALVARGAEVVICGHVHRARALRVPGTSPATTLYTLGAWSSGPSYLAYAGGVFRFVEEAP